MKAIVVVDRNLAIGRKGGLLYHIPSDLKHFRRETLGKTLIMGRKTLESMPGGKPLKGRNTLVLSRSLPEGEFWRDGEFFARVFHDKAELMAFSGRDAIVCGGAQIYSQFLADCDELIVTELEGETDDADAYFPEFRNEGSFEEYEDSGLIEEEGFRYHIRRYRKVDKRPETEGSCRKSGKRTGPWCSKAPETR